MRRSARRTCGRSPREGNFNNELGVPLTLCRIEPDTELCIVEMGMRGLGQIAWLASFARPEIGLITNIAPVHLELVGTVENVARAKAELIEALPPGGTAVVPDEPLLEPYLTRTDIEIRRFGDRDWPLPAAIFVPRAPPAPEPLGRAHGLRRPRDRRCRRTAALEVEFSPLREEVIELADGVTLINDCYNANPVVDDARRSTTSRSWPGTGARSRCSATWPSSATRRLPTTAATGDRGRARRRRRRSSPSARSPPATRRPPRASRAARSPRPARPPTRSPALVRPGDVVLVKGSRSVGLEAVAAKLRA